MTRPTYPAPKTATREGEALTTVGAYRPRRARRAARDAGRAYAPSAYAARTLATGRRPLAIASIVSFESRSSSVLTTQ